MTFDDPSIQRPSAANGQYFSPEAVKEALRKHVEYHRLQAIEHLTDAAELETLLNHEFTVAWPAYWVHSEKVTQVERWRPTEELAHIKNLGY